MEKDKKEKQKKIFLLSLVFIILLFGTFVIAAIKFVNSDNNKGEISTKTPITSTASISNEKVESNTIKKDTIESSTISISTESAKDNKEEKVNESDKEDKKTVEQNTNESKEEVNTENENSQQSNSKKDTSLNNSGNVSNNNSSSNGSSNNNSSSEKNNNEEIKKEENKEEEKPKFIVNININMVDNTIFSSQIVLENEVTAFEALKYYCENNSIQIGYTGSGQFIYVSSINGIKEKSEGPSSGWMYKVNGTFPNVSAGKYKLSSNDTLEWVFTKDGGKDVGQR
ncbi:MAG: DUF4430 domain-containing protein [Clostridium sp.]|nr:DUF4430 domain-containing protein [Clostridium sp.]